MALWLASSAAVCGAQTVTNGSSMTMRSSGASSGTAWNLTSDGYVGTYIKVPAAGATVHFDINAIGTSSNSVLPNMTLSVAGTNVPFTVAAGSNGDYTADITLPGDSASNANGTYSVRVQLDNQTATATPSLKINSVSVNGATVSNSTTDTLALNAAQTYADKFRSGSGAITLTNSNGIHLGAGTSVQVKLKSNAFSFAAAVYGNSVFSSDSQWIGVGSNGQYLAPTAGEQTNYQNAIKSNFNMIVPANSGKWINNEFSQNSVNMNLTDAMTQFATQNGLRVRMHNLIWNTEQPAFISGMFNGSGTFTGNQTTLINDINSRADYYTEGNVSHVAATHRANSYTEMDVFNEPWHGQSAQVNYLASGALTTQALANVYSRVAADDTSVGANTRLYTNEYNVLQFSPAAIDSKGNATGNDNYANWYLNDVQAIQRAGGPVGGIGAELYVTSAALTASTMQQAFGNLSVAKDPSGNPMPLTLSEFGPSTYLATPTSVWASQSTYIADLQTALTMAYGNPQATTFGYWGGIGGPNEKGETSVTSTNPIPAYTYTLYDGSYVPTAVGLAWQAWMSQYNTNLTLTTDANGNINFNGTYGTYQITAGGLNYSLNLVPGTTNYGLLIPITTDVWNGNATTDSNWNTATNWANSTFVANTPVVFTGTNRLSSNNNSAANTQYGGLTFIAGAGTFVISGNAIKLAGDVVNNSSSLQTINIALALQQNTNFNAASADLAVGGNISGSFSLTKTGSGTLTLTGTNTYSAGTAVTGGKLIIGSGSALPANTALAITGPGAMQLNTGIGVQTLASLSLPMSGKIDLADNDIIIHNGDAVNIPLQLQAGYAGHWNGSSGILSTTAAADLTFLTTLGYRQSDGTPFDSINTTTTDYLVKFTYYGDADLNGIVNGADYQQIDHGFGQNLTGWFNGDFNYDGVVDGTDYALIDNTFNQISATNAAPLAILSRAASTSAVPEPATLALFSLGAISLLSRRRR